jgi:hypothetical protein
MRPAERAQQRQAADTRIGWLEHDLTHKTCRACQRELPLDDFGPNAKNAGRVGKGRATYCRACEAARLRAKRATRTYQAPRP